jgi:beta-lactamase class A
VRTRTFGTIFSKGFRFRRLRAAAVAVGGLALLSSAHVQAATDPPFAPANLLPPQLIPSAPVVSPEEIAARRALDARIQAAGRTFAGRVGLAIRDLQTGWTSSYNGSAFFPQQSVSKFWVALTALEKVDRGELDLNAPVVVKREDLTLFHQPVAALVKGDGYKTTLSDLMWRAITESDNTANDFVLHRAGGPEAVRNFLRRHDISGVRFGPGERLLQSKAAGMNWKQEYSIGGAFYTARAKVPTEIRRSAFNSYAADPPDGATPLGIVDGLAKLERGELLSPESTRRLIRTMSNTKTGPQRLKGALAPGWTVAHKTGTGQVLGPTVAGYNDIGIVTAPDGRSYAVAVMIGRTDKSIPERWKLMHETLRAAIAYHDASRGMRSAGLGR